MNEDGHLQVFASFEEIEKLRLSEVQLVDVRSDLDTREADRLAAFEFFDRECRILQGHRAEPDKTERVFGNDIGNVIVKELRNIRAVRRARPIAEHHGHGGQDLCGYTGLVHLFDTANRVPTVGLDVAKLLTVILCHSSTSRI